MIGLHILFGFLTFLIFHKINILVIDNNNFKYLINYFFLKILKIIWYLFYFMTDIVCDQDFKNCPYRIHDLEKDYPLCDYFRLHARLIINREFSKIPSLIRRACGWVLQEESRLKFIRSVAQKKTMDFLANAKVGDSVFCIRPPWHDVRLLEKPLNDSAFVSCETPKGKIIRVQACHLYRISKGSYYGEYFIEGTENEKKAQEFEYKAEYYGFRAEIEKKDNGFLLKIYGDSQQEVDEFINVVLKQGFELII